MDYMTVSRQEVWMLSMPIHLGVVGRGPDWSSNEKSRLNLLIQQ